MRRDDLILLNMAGIGKKSLGKISKTELSRKVISAKKEHDSQSELEVAKSYDVEVTTLLDKKYPKALRHIYSMPLVLYSKGKGLQTKEIAIAIVGSRSASAYGIMTAEKLAYDLASKGVVIVSGLARGIDSAAHRGALKAHGKTIAVLGNGLKSIYPKCLKQV